MLSFSVIQRNRRRIQGRRLKSMPSKNSFPNFNRIDENLREIIESEARPGERYDDTILRLLREKKDRIEKLDHLNQELSQEIERYSRGQKDGK
jgi:hypothetical protein